MANFKQLGSKLIEVKPYKKPSKPDNMELIRMAQPQQSVVPPPKSVDDIFARLKK